MEPDVPGRYHDGAGPTFRASSSLPGQGQLVPDVLTFLRGTWRVQRRLVDHAAGGTGTFDGVARFARFDDPADVGLADVGLFDHVPVALAYHEDGELRFRGYSGQASRSLIYRGRSDGTADVRFADGREFYHLDPRPGSWQAQHQCGSDRYTVTGRLLSGGSFQERWRARGPGKDYEIVSTLIRSEP